MNPMSLHAPQCTNMAMEYKEADPIFMNLDSQLVLNLSSMEYVASVASGICAIWWLL